TALGSSTVLLAVKEGGAMVATASAVADADGNWGYTFDEVLHNGTYAVSAQSRDGRGALSLSVESTPISVTDRPIIQLGVLRLGMGGAASLLLCILIAGFAGGFVFYKKRREKLSQRLLVAETDVAKVFRLISEDVKNLRAGVPETEASTLIIERLQNNIKKMEGYLRKELENVDRT
ncbi:MAG TPA: hypothetical protein VF803_01825, partial [Candidatus Paceibacterota bacterium]